MANGKTIHVGRAFSEAWDVFTKNAGPAIAAYLIFMGLATAAGYVFCIGTIAWIFALQFPLMGGLTIFYLNLVKGRKSEVSDIFLGFREFGKWLGVGWLYVLISLAAMIPFMFSVLVAVGLYFLGQGVMHSGPIAGWFVAGMVISIAFGLLVSGVISTYLMLRYYFVYYAAAEGAGILEAFGRSAELTRGVRLELFLVVIVLTMFAMAGAIIFLIGQLFTSMIAMLVYTRIYLDLKAQEAPTGTAAREQ